MQLMTTGATAPTMTSSDIAELVGSRHDDVKRSIDRLAERGVIVRPPMADVSTTDAVGRPRLMGVYLIGKRDSYVIVAQLSPEFTARLVDRWQELEAGAVAALPNFSDPVAAARAWADAKEGEQRAIAQVEAARPKIEFVDRYVGANGSKGFREVAKLLKANEREFRDFLIARGIMYRLGGALMPKGPHLGAGRFEVKTGASDDGHAFNQAKFTPKGVTWIAGEWAKHQIEDAA